MAEVIGTNRAPASSPDDCDKVTRMSDAPERGYAGLPGTAHPIVQVGDPVLSTPCVAVDLADPGLAQLVADMFASMVEARGVGLAANQIGVGKRVFVYDCPDEDEVMHRGVVVNPVLILPGIEDRDLVEDDEGCLSVVGQHASLARPSIASVVGVDPQGREVRVDGTGTLARCLQHECDHLDGTLYIDRLSAKARREVLKAHVARLD